MQTYQSSINNAKDKAAMNENDVRILVTISKDLGGSMNDVTKSAVLAFGIPEKEAGTLVKKYW